MLPRRILFTGYDTKKGGFEKNADGSVRVYAIGGKGKLIPASTDGVAYYYTSVPASKNFTLTAKAKINSWKLSNGQEGFGLMAADRVGSNGFSGKFWNNSYMAVGTKVEYFFDQESNEVTDDSSKTKVTMKLGLGSQEKKGVTADNLSRLEANDTKAVTEEFSSEMRPLEWSCGSKGAGTYNLFGNSEAAVTGTVASPLTEVTLTIQKNNTGYFVSYTDAAGHKNTNKYYDPDALEKLNTDKVYVGLFASRNFDVTYSDIDLKITDPATDPAAEPRPVKYVTPDYRVVSATTANKSDYQLDFVANADGKLTVAKADGTLVKENMEVTHNAYASIPVTLESGENAYKLTFTPNSDFKFDKAGNKLLSTYESQSIDFTVTWAGIGDGDTIYVSQNGSASGDGTSAKPVDIYTAVKYVQAGQTILLQPGTYSLNKTVTVARGIDGTADRPITMKVNGSGRAIFDFQRTPGCGGMIFAGNYWNVSGIDCTRSGNAMKGITLSGSHCTFTDIRTYENGNTGFQISRFLSSDQKDLWPSDDLIKNCTSYANADEGYEDADGFAAKLTVGDGIVFDNCMAYNNADDGWDLFAKVETGPIGAVTIQNCLAFSNGIGVDGTDEGNGNGFKMGGSSISGHHKLINSVAFNNKAKGIDSNSCPDIQVKGCTTYNNGSFNVAFYTNDAKNTDFAADGILSFRNDGGVDEQFKLKGTQDASKVYGDTNFYVTDGTSKNKSGLTVTADWFKSLATVKASVSDPYAVAAKLRNSDGSINLGTLLALSDAGKKALSDAGLDTAQIGATLGDGVKDVSDHKNTNNGGSSSGSSSSGTKKATTTTAVGTSETSVKLPENASAEEKTAAQALADANEKKDFRLISGTAWDASLQTTVDSSIVKDSAEVKAFIASHANENVKITIVPAVEVEVKNADAKSLTYDITPKFNILLQAGSDQKLLEQRNKIPVTGTVTMNVPVPTSFAGNGETLYIIHKLDNGTKKYYSGVLANGILTFLNPDGFSEFVITKDKPAGFVESGVTTVYRLYNPVTGEHLYTLDAHEVDVITTTQGWVDETKGSAPMTALSKDASSGVPVYRFYCPSLGHHFYTTDVYERDVLKNNKDWNYEGIAFKAAPKGTGTAVYRLNKNGVAIHHYTNQKHEVDVLTSKNEWLDEGVAWYSFN